MLLMIVIVIAIQVMVEIVIDSQGDWQLDLTWNDFCRSSGTSQNHTTEWSDDADDCDCDDGPCSVNGHDNASSAIQCPILAHVGSQD